MSESASPTIAMPFELESLAKAVNYQQWVSEAIQPYMGRRILEVGAGIGNMSQWLPVRERLVLTETEPALLQILSERVPGYFGDGASKVRVAPLDLSTPTDAHLLESERFDTIISFNVLEHIEDDRAAIARLIDMLRVSDQPVRRLVAFVPAQAWALSDMDRFYGHFRRYSARRLCDLSRELAPGAHVSLTSFNAVGLLGWVWSTMILKRTTIDPGSVRAFDAMVPYLKPFDALLCRGLHYPFGQSLIWVLTLPSENLTPLNSNGESSFLAARSAARRR